MNGLLLVSHVPPPSGCKACPCARPCSRGRTPPAAHAHGHAGGHLRPAAGRALDPHRRAKPAPAAIVVIGGMLMVLLLNRYLTAGSVQHLPEGPSLGRRGPTGRVAFLIAGRLAECQPGGNNAVPNLESLRGAEDRSLLSVHSQCGVDATMASPAPVAAPPPRLQGVDDHAVVSRSRVRFAGFGVVDRRGVAAGGPGPPPQSPAHNKAALPRLGEQPGPMLREFLAGPMAGVERSSSPSAFRDAITGM